MTATAETKMYKRLLVVTILVVLALASTPTTGSAQANKPNILIIWGDDIGRFNISAYNRRMMGYKTPNIDRIANDGILFTDAYGDRTMN